MTKSAFIALVISRTAITGRLKKEGERLQEIEMIFSHPPLHFSSGMLIFNALISVIREAARNSIFRIAKATSERDYHACQKKCRSFRLGDVTRRVLAAEIVFRVAQSRSSRSGIISFLSPSRAGEMRCECTYFAAASKN